MIAVIRAPLIRLGLVSVVSSGLTHLSTAQNALDIGTPRALPAFARRHEGAVFPGLHDTVARGNLPLARGGYSFRVGSDFAPKHSQPFGRTTDSIKG